MRNGLKQRITHIVKFQDKNGKESGDGKNKGDFERRLVELVYNVNDNRNPFDMIWVK